jgi:hypothetical protein
MAQIARKNLFQKSEWIARQARIGVCLLKPKPSEKSMSTVVHVSKHLIPVERIALFEPFVMPEEPPFSTSKDFKSRIVLLDKMSILTEETPEELAQANGFRMNPTVAFGVETFTPVENFQPTNLFSLA